LLLHRTLPAAAVAAGIEAALILGSFDADLVAVEARSALLATGGTSRPIPVPLPVTASANATTARPAPSLAAYDHLLTEAIA